MNAPYFLMVLDIEFVVVSSEQHHATAPALQDVILETVNGLRSAGTFARG